MQVERKNIHRYFNHEGQLLKSKLKYPMDSYGGRND